MTDQPEAVESEAAAARGAPRRSAAIAVDLDQCKACGICIELCPKDVFDRDEKGYPLVARPEDCTICRFCEQHCPDFAIEVAELPGERGADHEAEGGA